MKFQDRVVHISQKLRGISPYSMLEAFNDSQRVPEDDDLSRLFYSHKGRRAHKWAHYLPIYDRHLSPFRGKPIKLLEIGVMHGGSLQIWRQYFGTAAIIFGIDINPQTKQFEDQHASIRIGSQADPDFLRKTIEEMGGIDIVIDDGSHVAGHQRISFDVLFPALSMGGLYAAEDLHTAYWRGEFEGGFRRAGTFIEETKRLVDDMHFWYHNASRKHSDVAAVHFYDSLVVVEKRRPVKPCMVSAGVGKPPY